MKNHIKQENGFTLIEILVVISIIAILFVTLLPQIDFAGDKSRETGVKTDFHTFQVGAESYLREIAGRGRTYDGLNSFLDKGMKLTDPGPGIDDFVYPEKLDPWGNKYKVYIDPNYPYIMINSFGKNIGIDKDDFLLVTYYHNGTVASCSVGFKTNNIESDFLNEQKLFGGDDFVCGGNIDQPELE